MSKLVKKDGKLVKKNGKFLKTNDAASCPCCGGDGPCPPGKYCTWVPPDPCTTGKCRPDRIEDTPPIQSQCGDAPYDCTSEAACNQWYEQNPNPPCDCWFCEDGEWINKPSLNCFNEGGILGQKPPAEDCQPPCDGESEQGTWQLELCDEEDCTFPACGQSGSGVGPKFLTQQDCRDCHNLRETCSLDHPLCVLNRNPLP
jgi:hypothetical protein